MPALPAVITLLIFYFWMLLTARFFLWRFLFLKELKNLTSTIETSRNDKVTTGSYLKGYIFIERQSGKSSETFNPFESHVQLILKRGSWLTCERVTFLVKLLASSLKISVFYRHVSRTLLMQITYLIFLLIENWSWMGLDIWTTFCQLYQYIIYIYPCYTSKYILKLLMSRYKNITVGSILFCLVL